MDITTEVIAAFRDRMKAFADDTKWPDEVVSLALCEGDTATGNACRWGPYVDECHNFKQRGMFYYAAHWLSSFYGRGGAADPGAVTPEARLNVSGKSVGDESINYRITAIQSTGADWLSTTIYGVQYWMLQQRAGMGAMAV